MTSICTAIIAFARETVERVERRCPTILDLVYQKRERTILILVLLVGFTSWMVSRAAPRWTSQYKLNTFNVVPVGTDDELQDQIDPQSISDRILASRSGSTIQRPPHKQNKNPTTTPVDEGQVGSADNQMGDGPSDGHDNTEVHGVNPDGDAFESSPRMWPTLVRLGT